MSLVGQVIHPQSLDMFRGLPNPHLVSHLPETDRIGIGGTTPFLGEERPGIGIPQTIPNCEPLHRPPEEDSVSKVDLPDKNLLSSYRILEQVAYFDEVGDAQPVCL